jgi:hypothetical protein
MRNLRAALALTLHRNVCDKAYRQVHAKSDGSPRELHKQLLLRLQFLYPEMSRTHVWTDFETLSVVLDC